MTYPAYPPPQPGYPPQQGYYQQQQPAYPPQQGYGPPQGYGAPPPQQPLARGTIDEFYGQPAASGKSISFNGKPPGTSYTGIVARTLTNADIQQQTDINRRPLYHPDGRPKYVMIIPLVVAPSAEFPDGRAAWYVKGADKTELERAMEAAGLPPGTAPEPGARITITYTGDRPIPNLNAQKVKQITYARPQGAAPVQPAAPVGQPANDLGPQPNGQAAQDMVTGNGQAPPWAQTPPPPAAVPPQPAAAAQPPMQPPPGLSPEQQAYLAQLTGQAQ